MLFYGCETWSLKLREEGRLKGFECRVLRRIFGPKRYEVKGEWRKLHNEELNGLYCSPKNYLGDQTEKKEVGESCSTYGERTGVYRVLVGKPEGKSPLGRPGRRWKDNIKVDLQEVGWDGLD